MSKDIPILRYAQKDYFAEIADYLRYAEVADWCDENLAPLLEALEKEHFAASYFGEDFARSGDLTDILPLLEMQDASFRNPFLVELRNIPYQQQEQILFYIVDRLPRFSGGALDSTGNGDYLAERAMQEYGANCIAKVKLSESWYRENMPRYKAAFEDRTILLPKDADIIADHRALKIIKGIARVPEERTKGQDKKKRHGDSAIAGSLALFAAYEFEGNVGLPKVQSAGARATTEQMTAYHGGTNYSAY